MLRGAQQQGAQRVTSLGRPTAIDRGGAPGQFIPRGYQTQPFGGGNQGVQLGAIPLANARAVRQPTLAQAPPPQPVQLAQGNGAEVPPVTTPRPVPPGKALAWGMLKKQDAAELAEHLAEIERRMMAADIPAGIVAQIREKLSAFARSDAPEDADIELSETEAESLNVAIMNLESVESESKPSFATAAAVIAGVGLIVAAVAS